MPVSKKILRHYLNTIFIETGTLRGDGVQAALKAGFSDVFSTENDPFNFGWCSCRFQGEHEKVHLFGKDSRLFLKELLPRLTTRATFWLDAHYCGGNQVAGDLPLLEELEIISCHSIKNHTILIDDVRLMGTPDMPVRLNDVYYRLLVINPAYEIGLIDSPEFTLDILRAWIP